MVPQHQDQRALELKSRAWLGLVQWLIDVVMLIPWIMVITGIVRGEFLPHFSTAFFVFLPTGLLGLVSFAAIRSFASENVRGRGIRTLTLCLFFLNIIFGTFGWMLLAVVTG